MRTVRNEVEKKGDHGQGTQSQYTEPFRASVGPSGGAAKSAGQDGIAQGSVFSSLNS